MKKTRIILTGSLLFFFLSAICQSPGDSFSITVLNDRSEPVEAAGIEMISTSTNNIQKANLTDRKGAANFTNIPAGNYYFRITHTGHETITTAAYNFPLTVPGSNNKVITLQASGKTLESVKILSTRPFIQRSKGKVLINPDASVTNTGTTVLELLEKSPGIMVDKNGTISMQAKTGVLVLIDDKPTYLSGTDLSNLLGSMSSTQVDQIELMANPPAKYDASGNAGIINIKTKKNKQKGFNGTLTIAASQGVYPKNNNSLVLNYRNGKFNSFITYSANINKYFTDIYALRNYYDINGFVTGKLDQPTSFTGEGINNTLRMGVDFYASPKTTIGISLMGVVVNRTGKGYATATWLDASGNTDSAIITTSKSGTNFRNGGINVNLKQVINKSQELSVDLDIISYKIRNDQLFNNRLDAGGGYSNSSQGNIPSGIDILSVKADHVYRPGKNNKLESGWKSSRISTDNLAAYQYYDGTDWLEDFGKSNHFLYKEYIHALYSSFEQKYKKVSFQAGIRYELTSYDADQLGNAQRKDSSFSRNYDGFFPSGYISYEMDSSNTITFTGGKRIDRPAFQKLNPFVTIINKYTYQRGNPYFLPQYSWNMELSHQYKQLLTTTLSYSITKNYFSQLFLNEGGDILTYTEGNVGKAHNLGISMSLQLNPARWWTLTGQGMFNYKELIGFNGNDYTSTIRQFNFSMNNQFRFAKVYAGEISGFYTTRARNDLQELLYPTGQLSLGISRPVLKKKGTLKLAARDIFFTQKMEGLTQFEKADEYFILSRDTRVLNISFTYRFGKPLKTARRNSGGATDEMQRVGGG